MLDQIYTDFTTKLLPQIKQGLIITKDYFTDLFGRYVKYLIVSDSIYSVLFLIILIAAIYLFYRGIKHGNKNDWCDGPEIPMVIIGAFGIIIGSIFLIYKINDLVKDIYIPEVRVIQEIQNFKSQ